MSEYHKIKNVFKRDQKTHKLIIGDYYSSHVDMMRNCNWYALEKIDGTNIRIMWNPETDEVTIGGKTDKAQLHVDLLTAIQELFLPLPKKNIFREKFPDTPVVLYGEGYGAGIQKGGSYRKDKGFIMFDAKIGNTFVNVPNMCEIAGMFEVDHVPIWGVGTIDYIVDGIQMGMKSSFGDFWAEGVVARPEVETYDNRGNRIIVKIKHKELYGSRT